MNFTLNYTNYRRKEEKEKEEEKNVLESLGLYLKKKKERLSISVNNGIVSWAKRSIYTGTRLHEWPYMLLMML